MKNGLPQMVKVEMSSSTLMVLLKLYGHFGGSQIKTKLRITDEHMMKQVNGERLQLRREMEELGFLYPTSNDERARAWEQFE